MIKEQSEDETTPMKPTMPKTGRKPTKIAIDWVSPTQLPSSSKRFPETLLREIKPYSRLFITHKNKGSIVDLRWINNTSENTRLVVNLLIEQLILKRFYHGKKYFYYPCCNVFSRTKTKQKFVHKEHVEDAVRNLLTSKPEQDQIVEFIRSKEGPQLGSSCQLSRKEVKAALSEFIKNLPLERAVEFIREEIPQKDGCFFFPLVRNKADFECLGKEYFDQLQERTLSSKIDLTSSYSNWMKKTYENFIAPFEMGVDVKKESNGLKKLKICPEELQDSVEESQNEIEGSDEVQDAHQKAKVEDPLEDQVEVAETVEAIPNSEKNGQGAFPEDFEQDRESSVPGESEEESGLQVGPVPQPVVEYQTEEYENDETSSEGFDDLLEELHQMALKGDSADRSETTQSEDLSLKTEDD